MSHRQRDRTPGADNFAQNGGYINPPRIKRQFRDPHGDWWDKQERRNFGEPVHEDHDILGMFSTYEYTWVGTGKGLFQIGCFVAVFLSVCYAAKLTYPDRPSYPREYEGGLERELGGAGGIRASRVSRCWLSGSLTVQSRPEWRATRNRKFERKELCISKEQLSNVNRVPLSPFWLLLCSLNVLRRPLNRHWTTRHALSMQNLKEGSG